jgi:hypothetical protein
MITYRNAGKDGCRTTDPDVVTKTNWRHPDWTRRLKGMVIRVENGHQVPDAAIVTDYDAMISHDRGTGVDEDALADHKGSIAAGAHLDWYCLTAQEQASALDRSEGDKHRMQPIHSHDGRSRTGPPEYGGRP